MGYKTVKVEKFWIKSIDQRLKNQNIKTPGNDESVERYEIPPDNLLSFHRPMFYAQKTSG